MTNKVTVKEALDTLNEKYANTLLMLDDALDKIEDLEKQLDKKPKEVIVEKEVEIIKEVNVPVEKIIEKEKIVEKPVEIEKIVEVEKIVSNIVEVPVERIKEVSVIKEDTSKIQQLEGQLQKLKNYNIKLEKDLNNKEEQVEVEIVEKESTKDLRHAANIMASSELNKEDLSADQIYNILVKSSEEELKKKLGFWAIPLPKKGDIDKNTNKRYIKKK